MKAVAKKAVALVQSSLEDAADATKAPAMQAYMKTDMPFYGVQKAGRRPILKALKKACPAADVADYQAVVEALWALPHREEKYLAQDYAAAYKTLAAELANRPLFESMVREGAWWDFVDHIAAHLLGAQLRVHRRAMNPVVDGYVTDDDMWIRRTALLVHLQHKDETDHARLFRTCLALAHEKEFFIRKAIGWVLRQYSKTAPDRVRAFVDQHEEKLSGLSLREARKYL